MREAMKWWKPLLGVLTVVTLIGLASLQIFTGNPSYHYLPWWYRLSFTLNPAILVFAFCAKPRGKNVDVDGKGSVPHKL